jgi:hypothetical protein
MTFVANSFAVALASAAIAWTGMSFVAPASAEPMKTFTAAFKYDSGAPASTTYDGLKNQAHKACLTESRPIEFGPIASRVRWMQRCEADLVGKAVAAIGKSELTALHEQNRAPGQVAAR